MRGDLDEGLKGVEVDEEKLANLIKRRKTYCDITQVIPPLSLSPNQTWLKANNTNDFVLLRMPQRSN